jgi:hypothetical protein
MNSTAATPQNHASFRKQIGSALWLWETPREDGAEHMVKLS